ncbi:MAG: hypothetical protein O7C39_01285, partial [Bacteroidetes bacterium]|nr:hypothetical protein [Bacteroidota bacterium]
MDWRTQSPSESRSEIRSEIRPRPPLELRIDFFLVWLLASLLLPIQSFAQEKEKEEEAPPEHQTVLPAPDRGEDEGEGPFERLIIRGVTVIDGTGAPPRGPVDLVI